MYLGELERRHSALQYEVQQFRRLFPTVQQERNLYEHLIARCVTENYIAKQKVEEWTFEYNDRCVGVGNKDTVFGSTMPPKNVHISDADSARTDSTVVDKSQRV